MTFLQPFILYGLPLALLPIIIHLINRMRHRPQQWAAMRFLLSATRSSTGHAKLRQFLILLCRVSAVLALIFFLARPLAGGWLGWALSPAPDAVLMLLDRSASMETKVPGIGRTKREQAVELFAQAAEPFAEASHLVLIENAFRAPQALPSLSSLRELSLTAPTDTAADIPAMLNAALRWLIDNRAGTAEIWIASDLQRSNWKPEDPRWASLLTQFRALPQKVRVRLLGLAETNAPNKSIAFREILRRRVAGRSELQFIVDLQSNASGPQKVPLIKNIDGARSQTDLAWEGPALRWRNRAEIPETKTGGWGSFEIPADANPRDNVAYFVYGADQPLRALIAAGDPASARIFKLAASVLSQTNAVDSISSTSANAVEWPDKSLVIWQGQLPEGAVAERARQFVDSGGMILFFPPGEAGRSSFQGLSWGEVQPAPGDTLFRIARWDRDQGPLAQTEEGIALPVDQIEVKRRQMIAGAKTFLASFSDGNPFLARLAIGRGEVFFCATLPNPEWSTLADGPVLVPLVQRTLQAGARRLQRAASVACGELSIVDQTKTWSSVDAPGKKEVRTQAGVYRSGEQLVAVNRPEAEDDIESVDVARTAKLFAGMPFQLLIERQSRSSQIEGEIWRAFVFLMLLFLLAESALVLPPRSARAVSTPSPAQLQPTSTA